MGHLPTIVERVRQVTLDQPDTLGDGDCEALRSGLIGQPVNTISSVAYAGSGVWLASRVAHLPDSSRSSALAFAALAAVTGVGSIAYHGPQFAGAQFMHDLPIVGVLGIGVVVPMWRLRAGRSALPGWSSRRGLALVAAGAAAGASYLAGRTTSPLCRPDSLLQPHGLWHLGTAAIVALWGATVWAPSPEQVLAEEVTVAEWVPPGAVTDVDGVSGALGSTGEADG